MTCKFTGNVTQSTPPTSPATLLYRGASFDVVNPHASLLVTSQEFETPAEIDGLLDDYFDDRVFAPQTSNENSNSDMSQQSLEGSSDSGRHARVPYDDADSARRNIMRKATTQTPPKAEVSDDHSPLSSKHNVIPLQSDLVRPLALPKQTPSTRANSNPFRSITQALGFNRISTVDESVKLEDALDQDVAQSNIPQGTCDSPSTKAQLTVLLDLNQRRFIGHKSSRKRSSHQSDQFDLDMGGIEEGNRNDNSDGVQNLPDKGTELTTFGPVANASSYVASSCRSRLKNALTRYLSKQETQGTRDRYNRTGHHRRLRVH